MKPYRIRFTRVAEKDVQKLSSKLKAKLIDILTHDIALSPFSGKPLVGELKGFYSVRLSYQDRIVYTVDKKERTIYVHRARTHYGD